MNRIVLMGRLVRDPEIRYSNAAEPTAICRYTLAVNRQFKREGEQDADFINCTCFGRAAEFAEKWFKKGQLVAVEGRLNIREYTDTKSNERKWYTEVVLDNQYFAESKASFEGRQQSGGYDNSGGGQPAPARQAPQQQQSGPDSFFEVDANMDDDDLPF
ncbi:MAG: single-stranded DNA-binding protein [Defluviitaleaceae bacterium]|nr:single-stranded DNA-binding protein [Defluviitaleaceae bacterium]